MTKIQITPTWHEIKPSMHYVYVHIEKSSGRPFYVGLGQKKRAWLSAISARGSFWSRVALKHGVMVDIAQDCLTKDQASLLEMWLIAKFRSEGYRLVNCTDGGEGSHGYEHTPDSKVKMSAAQMGNKNCVGRKYSSETLEKISKANTGKKSRIDKNIHEFHHVSGISFIGIRYDFYTKYGLNKSKVGMIISGMRSKTGGWSYVKSL